MYAGSSGSNYGVNKNSRGNGNGKWQGLPPTVGHARNARHINIEAGGNNRNVVFCMNQLGGVGRISNMFATTADGVKDCKDGNSGDSPLAWLIANWYNIFGSSMPLPVSANLDGTGVFDSYMYLLNTGKTPAELLSNLQTPSFLIGQAEINPTLRIGGNNNSMSTSLALSALKEGHHGQWFHNAHPGLNIFITEPWGGHLSHTSYWMMYSPIEPLKLGIASSWAVNTQTFAYDKTSPEPAKLEITDQITGASSDLNLLIGQATTFGLFWRFTHVKGAEKLNKWIGIIKSITLKLARRDGGGIVDCSGCSHSGPPTWKYFETKIDGSKLDEMLTENAFTDWLANNDAAPGDQLPILPNELGEGGTGRWMPINNFLMALKTNDDIDMTMQIEFEDNAGEKVAKMGGVEELPASFSAHVDIINIKRQILWRNNVVFTIVGQGSNAANLLTTCVPNPDPRGLCAKLGVVHDIDYHCGPEYGNRPYQTKDWYKDNCPYECGLCSEYT